MKLERAHVTLSRDWRFEPVFIGFVLIIQAVEQLNIRTKSFKDLLTDEPYQRSDIITLQDPHNLEKFNLTNFHHVKNNLRVETEGILLFFVLKQTTRM